MNKMVRLILLIFLMQNARPSSPELDFVYHDYENMVDILKNFQLNFPEKIHLYSIGKSVLQRDLWVLAIANTHPNKHVTLRPEVKYIGNMHGNEAPGKEILLHLIEYMLNNQHIDANIDYIMKNSRLHIMVSMNPDGLEMSKLGDCYSLVGRFNVNDYDLNRNFPDLFSFNKCHYSNGEIQPETQAVINWLESNQFVLSANFHSGALVTNYPYDSQNLVSNLPYGTSLTNDDDLFRYLARNYSFNHLTMREMPQCNQEHFIDGITNGGMSFQYILQALI